MTGPRSRRPRNLLWSGFWKCILHALLHAQVSLGVRWSRVAGIVEILNPNKAAAVSFKRDGQRVSKRGRTVPISEVTLSEVKEDAVRFGLAIDVAYQMNAEKDGGS